MLLYTVCRILFYLLNYTYFQSSDPILLLKCAFVGLRFDITAISILNIPVLLLFIMPGFIFIRRGYQMLLNTVFYSINLPALLLNLIDIAYFPFSNKRSTADLIDVLLVGNDMVSTLPEMLLSFWYVPISLLLFFLFLRYCIKRENLNDIHRDNLKPFAKAMILLITVGLTAVGFRGGIQFRPIDRLSAAKYVDAKFAPVILNTAFTIIKTWNKEDLKPRRYFDEKTAEKYFNPIHDFPGRDSPNPNIVLIILESFSSEYIGYLNGGKGYTPVLDSLMQHSLVFDNAFANGKKSIEGIPAVVSGIPALMDAPFITSVYNSNRVPSLPFILSSAEYHCRFYHGGNNGTMGFDKFTALTGFHKYIGRNQYPNRDYDGGWGIFDEPFYLFMADELDQINQPFLSVFFSLSSHHPYNIPEKYEGKFEEGTLPIHQSVRYSDHALGKFFERARKSKWYENTVFIITADHTGPLDTEPYQTTYGKYAVPIVIFTPGDSLKGTDHGVCQQADIFASIPYIAGVKCKFKSYGQNLFDVNRKKYAVQYSNEIYQLITNSRVLLFDGNAVEGLYDIKKDPHMNINIFEEGKDTSELNLLKSLIQQYHHDMINNTLSIHENFKE